MHQGREGHPEGLQMKASDTEAGHNKEIEGKDHQYQHESDE